MNSQTSISRADLEFAEAALRDILRGDFTGDAKSDAASLRRMLVHLVNMTVAMSTSPERRTDVAKRLGDFAVTTSKMASRNPDVASKLTRLSESFRASSGRMRETLAALAVQPASA